VENTFFLDNKTKVGGVMKNLLTRILIGLGLVSFFTGTATHFEAHAKESSSSSSAERSGNMGGRSEGCGKSN